MNGKRLLVGIALVTMSVGAQADDRDLLRSRGAPPNVLLIVDSSGSMTAQAPSSSGSFIAEGDDPHSKAYDLKYALAQFYDAYPEFNMGFTQYDRIQSKTTIPAHQFLYRWDPAGTAFKFKWEVAIDAGVRKGVGSNTVTFTAGNLVKLGGTTSYSNEDFGPTGIRNYSDWSRDNQVSIGGTDVSDNGNKVSFTNVSYGADPVWTRDCIKYYSNGECRTWSPYYKSQAGKYFRVDVWLEEPNLGTGYFYPAYDWTTEVETAVNTFQGIHDLWAPDVTDPSLTTADRLYAYDQIQTGRATLQAVLDANQVGSRTLTMRATLRECVGSTVDVDIKDSTGECLEGSWITRQSHTRNLITSDGLTPHDLDAADAVDRPYTGSVAPDVTDQLNCGGIEGTTFGGTKVPMIPIPTDDDRDAMLPFMRSVLRPQWQMQLFFPTRPSGLKYWPKYFEDKTGSGWDNKGVWITERSIISAGNTPIAQSLDEARAYFVDEVRERDDPFRSCRSDFIIFVTDGLETCRSPNSTSPCTAATALKQLGIPVYLIAYGLGASGSSLNCIATNSGGSPYAADNVDELVEALRRVGQNIEERSRGFASPMVPSVEVSSEQKAYLASFLPLNGRSIWQGHLRAYPVDPYTGQIPLTDQGFPDESRALWDAGQRLKLMGHASRLMYFGDEATSGAPGTRTAFVRPTTTAARSKLRTYFGNTGLSDTQLNQIVDFIRGNRDTTTYQGEIMGDLFHGVPQLIGAPSCYPCWFHNLNDYSDFLSDHKHRRMVMYASADDGALHAVDAGLWDPDEGSYDDGSGDELFAWTPRAVMPAFEYLTFSTDHRWTVDGTPTVADVFIDRQFSSAPIPEEREWRSLLLVGQRDGGRSYVCLDVTQPDDYDTDDVPIPEAGASDRGASCRNGGSECSTQWPEFRFEFTDTSDQNNDTAQDLGLTWSRPLVGFVKVVVGSGPSAQEESRNVAIFGGGFDPNGLSGRHIYMVDLETGKILFKSPTLGSVPGDMAAVDLDINGYLERLYWADTAGMIYRMDISTPGTVSSTTQRVTSWQPQQFFYAGADQPFFLRVAMAPAAYSATGEPMVALAIGTGNRDDLFEEGPELNRFYAVLDKNDYATLGRALTAELDLQEVQVNDTTTADNYLVSSTSRGWYLVLEEREKVNSAAVILNSMVIFSTFTPGEGVEIDPENPDLCQRRGNAKTYVVNLYNANGTDGDERFIQQDAGVNIVSEATVYLGADGEIHVTTALDDTRLEEPVQPIIPAVRTLSWKEE